MISNIICGPREMVLSAFRDAAPETLGVKPGITPGRWGRSSLAGRFSCDILNKTPGDTPSMTRLANDLRLPRGLQTVRVLFAEDSPEQRLLIKYYMGAFPCMIEFASDGIEVVEKFRRNPFPFVFMDMRMPRMDGLQATRAIRLWEIERKRYPARIIALTGLCTDLDMEQIRQAGCDSILAKPYSKREFLMKVKEVFQIP